MLNRPLLNGISKLNFQVFSLRFASAASQICWPNSRETLCHILWDKLGLQIIKKTDSFCFYTSFEPSRNLLDISELNDLSTFVVCISFLWTICWCQRNVMSSWKTRLIEEQKEQALISRRSFCVVSDQSMVFLSHMSICRNHLSLFLHNLKTTHEY